MSSDVERWKTKYLDKLEESEKLEKDLRDHLQLLERGLVRVSLAADGADPSVDEYLKNLRSLLRRTDYDRRTLSGTLNDLERQVIAMDSRRKGLHDSLLQSFRELIGALEAATPSRSQRRLLRKLGTDMENQVDSLSSWPGLLNAYGTILQQVLEGLIGSAGGRKQGLLSRLFGKSESDSGAPVNTDGEAGIYPDEAPGHEDAAFDSRKAAGTEPSPGAAPVDAETAGLSDRQRDGETPANSPATSTNARTTDLAPGPGQDTSLGGHVAHGSAAPAPGLISHMQGVLSSLLDQVSLPEKLNDARQSLLERLAGPATDHELMLLVDEVAWLVISAVGKGQQEFTVFLKQLDDRLASVQAFLSWTRDSQQSSRQNAAELESSMRVQVNQMQDSIDGAPDITTLKSSVEKNLDVVLSSIDAFMRKESDRDLALERELTQLKQRLNTMEEESGEIQARLQEETRKALTDTLTGLPNRVAWTQRLDEEFKRWQRYHRSLVLVVADIDHFKRVNDNYGHLSGDKVIQLIAKELARRVRATDFVARYGGEELVLLLPETSEESAVAVMEKAREMISRLPFHFHQEDVRITMSFGVTGFREGDTLDSAFERADQALYRAKENGRNQVCLAE